MQKRPPNIEKGVSFLKKRFVGGAGSCKLLNKVQYNYRNHTYFISSNVGFLVLIVSLFSDHLSLMDNTVAIGIAVLVTIITTIIIGDHYIIENQSSNLTLCLIILCHNIGVLWMCLRRGSKGRVICLLGLSNSGKTLLFMRVR